MTHPRRGAFTRGQEFDAATAGFVGEFEAATADFVGEFEAATADFVGEFEAATADFVESDVSPTERASLANVIHHRHPPGTVRYTLARWHPRPQAPPGTSMLRSWKRSSRRCTWPPRQTANSARRSARTSRAAWRALPTSASRATRSTSSQ